MIFLEFIFIKINYEYTYLLNNLNIYDIFMLYVKERFIKHMKYEDVPKLIEEFLEYMEVMRNRSYNTVKEYHYDLRNVCKYLKCYKNNISLEKLDSISILDLDINFFKTIETQDFYSYLKYLNDDYRKRTKKDLKSTSRARKVASIKSFYNYLANNRKLLDKNPVVRSRNSKT